MDKSLRIKQLIDEKKMSISQFELEIGVGFNTIRKILQRNSNISGKIMDKILQKYPEISMEWLISGTGSMYKSKKYLLPEHDYIEVASEKEIEYKRMAIESMQELVKAHEKIIKLQDEKILSLEQEKKNILIDGL